MVGIPLTRKIQIAAISFNTCTSKVVNFNLYEMIYISPILKTYSYPVLKKRVIREIKTFSIIS